MKQDRQDRAGSSYRHPDQATDEALDWFLRLGEDRDAKTLAAFDKWCRSDPVRAAAFDELVRLHAMPSLRRATLADASRLRAQERGSGGAKRKGSARGLGRGRLVGAAAAALLLAIAVVHQYPVLMLRWQSDYVTMTGERRSITLPDGSTVLMNTASAIAVDFEEEHRRVTLLGGEAFFDVRHDPAHPFVVTGHYAQVTVTGTAFSVRADTDADVVVLERGSVEVRRTSGEGSAETLQPGQMVIASRQGLSGTRPADPARTLAWRDGRIIFEDRPFGQALADLQRYFDGSVVMLGNRLDKRPVSGNYRIDDPEAAIRTLAVAAGASITRLPGDILILR
ncbi:FecR domain-containing protein [Rhizobium sp. CSW-27]|uniref:FecR family protein n=1 Tax=Rhizobium sp. CSW-27 TaxID=2839985 RepID=UPI001C02C26B|nr:FecR domain-containing protein [Rhizobium sp. CSW-27]